MIKTISEHKIVMSALREQVKEFSGAITQISDMADVTPQAVSSMLRGEWFSEKIYAASLKVLKYRRRLEKSKIEKMKREIKNA